MGSKLGQEASEGETETGYSKGGETEPESGSWLNKETEPGSCVCVGDCDCLGKTTATGNPGKKLVVEWEGTRRY